MTLPFISPLKTDTQTLKNIAAAVLKLSDFFIQNPDDKTPWAEKHCELAYRYYFLPLNILRNQLVISRGKKVNFFENIKASVDWGAGPGTASLALTEQLSLEKQILIERSTEAKKIFSDLHAKLKNPTHEKNLASVKINFKTSLLVLSYSLTENSELPIGWNEYEALMILEPSTQDDGRQLLQLRQTLIQNGYYIWAPCIHQMQCPLLTESKTDWCHDRIHVNAPSWFTQMEQYLPFKNKTITTSYLLARKTPPKYDFKNQVRLVGDSLEEKGKTRQLMCRGEKREFLTWMHKEIEPQTLPRGELITLPEEIEIKSNEVRVKHQLDLNQD